MGSDDDEDRHFRKFGNRHKIMVSAIFSLFAAVLIIILLHLYLRYRHRRRRESRLITLETAQQITRADRENHTTAAPPPKSGLDPLVIARILPESVHKQSDHRGEIVECSICLSNIEEKSSVRILPNCKHLFHVGCIDMWLFSNTTCPVCRTPAEPAALQPPEHGELPTAPPLTEEQSSSRFSSFRRTMSRDRSQAVQPTAPPLTEEQSGSRLSSFRRILGRERSFRVHSCGEGSVRAADLERQ